MNYRRFELENGLRCITYEDNQSTTAVLNTLYNVGAKDENPERTGFAHLFEHLMFGGSIHIPHYDQVAENAGASNNAFTNNDFTNYYISLPVENVETAMWLESDRMFQLAFSPKSLEVQRGVVTEEFQQRCFNAPFGKLWHHLRQLVYPNHPYSWPTIGKEIQHITDATLEEVMDFYKQHYNPNNAILALASPLEHEQARKLIEKWFGDIQNQGPRNPNQYPAFTKNNAETVLQERDLSPNKAVFLAWPGPSFTDEKSICLEMFADMLGGSETSPIYQTLVKQGKLFNAAESFYLRTHEAGMFVLYGILNEGVSHENAQKELQNGLFTAINRGIIQPYYLEKTKNMLGTQIAFQNTQLTQIAQKLCVYELFNQTNLLEKETELYQIQNFEAVLKTAKTTLLENAPSILYYSPIHESA